MTDRLPTMDRNTLHLILGLAHELRTPISAIAGHTSLLSLGVHGPLSDAQAESLRRIQLNQQYLLTMISDAVQYAEAAAGNVELDVHHAPLWPIVSEAVEGMRVLAEQRSMQLELSTQSADAASDALLDDGATRIVLDAMLHDALDHGAAGDRVEIGMQQMERSLQIMVIGDSKSFTAEQAELVFLPFARDGHGRPVHASARALSLPLARALARAMGGELRGLSDRSRRTLAFDVPRANLSPGVG